MGKPVPDHLPMNANAIMDFHKLQTTDISALFSACETELKESMDQYLECAADINELTPLMEELSNSVEDLNKQEGLSENLKRNVTASKAEFVNESKKCSDVTLETWDQYRENELVAPNLEQIFNKFMANQPDRQTNTASRVSDINKILRVLPFIWEDPTCILPDDNEVNDDLMIDGGKIDLTCPITLKPYVKPLISKKCQHVFEYEGIKNYIGTEKQKSCPQAGCNRMLTIKDFSPDPIMALRCQIAKLKAAQQQSKEAELDIL